MKIFRTRFFLFLIFLLIANVGRGQETSFNSFDGTKIVYTDEGVGKPVLLIHGFINTRKNWDKSELKKDLISKGYRVIAPDLRGNGDSEKPQEDDAYANDAEVTDLVSLMDHLQIKRYKVVGYSRGSIVLAKLLTVDKRIKKAVLGGMGLDFSNPDWDRRLMFADAFAGNMNDLTQGAVDYAKSINADLRSLHLQQKHQPITTKAELKTIKKRVLVLAGDQDLDNGSPAELQQALPKASLQLVSGDHNGTYKTNAFSEAVVSFLR